MIIPPRLKKSDKIGVMAPSSFITKDDIEKAKSIVESYGYGVYIHPQTYEIYNQSAGTNEQKTDAFHDLIRDPDINAIFFATGGNRAMHWVDMIDFDLVKSNPKIIMGFSDCTVPLNIIHENTGLVTYHGPNFRWFMVHENNKADIEQCFDVLSSDNVIAAQTAIHGDIDNHNEIKAPLIGGNLSLFQYLLDDVDCQDKILFIEDRYIETSRLDRMLCALKRNGVFNQIKAILIGDFSELLDTERPYGFSMDDMLAEHVPSHIPIIRDCPFGHADRLITLPIGQEIIIKR